MGRAGQLRIAGHPAWLLLGGRRRYVEFIPACARRTAAAQLCGEFLDGIAIHPQTGRTEFFFDLGGRITPRWPRAEAPEDGELWSLHSRSRFVAVFDGGRYDTGPLNTAATNPRLISTSDWLVVARGR